MKDFRNCVLRGIFWFQAEMPFSGHEGEVTGFLEEFREHDDVFGQVSFMVWFTAMRGGIPSEFCQLSEAG